MKNIIYFWKYGHWDPAKHTELLYKHITVFDVLVLKWGKLTRIIPIMRSDTSCKTMHSDSKMTFLFQKFTKEPEAQGENGQSSTIPFFCWISSTPSGIFSPGSKSPLQPSPLNWTRWSSFPSLCITENRLLRAMILIFHNLAAAIDTKPLQHPATDWTQNPKTKAVPAWYFCWLASDVFLKFLKKKRPLQKNKLQI